MKDSKTTGDKLVECTVKAVKEKSEVIQNGIQIPVGEKITVRQSQFDRLFALDRVH